MVLFRNGYQQILVESNSMPLTAKYACVHQLFEEQVVETPNSIAVVFEDEFLTYAELNVRANQLAYTLITHRVKADEPVAVALERSPEAVIAIFAILKAGGVYVPFDPDYPVDRLKFMLDDSGARILLTTEALRERLPLKAEHTICLDTDKESIAANPHSNPIHSIAPEHLAYIIYTSGSTGRPKGVEVEHRSIVLHCQTVKACFQLRDLENTDLPVIISSYCNVKTGELAYEDICNESQRHKS